MKHSLFYITSKIFTNLSKFNLFINLIRKNVFNSLSDDVSFYHRPSKKKTTFSYFDVNIIYDNGQK